MMQRYVRRAGVAGLLVLSGQASGQFNFSGSSEGRPFTFEFISPATFFPGFRAGINDAEIDGQTDAFDGFGLVRVNGTEIGSSSFEGSPTDNQGRYSFAQSLGGDLFVGTSYWFSPNIPFVRHDVKLLNRGDAPVTFTVEVEGNVGADGQQAIFATSDGNTTLGPSDRWVIGDEAGATNSGSPATGFVFGGPGAEVSPSLVSDLTTYFSNGNEGYRVVHEVTVDPFDDRVLSYFWEIETDVASLQSGIQVYDVPSLLDGLAYFSPQFFGDNGRQANFDRLETWDGTVSGSLLQPAGWEFGSVPDSDGAEVRFDRNAFVPAGESLQVDALVLDRATVRVRETALLSVTGRFVIDSDSELFLEGSRLSPSYIVLNDGLLAVRGSGNRIFENGSGFPVIRNTGDFEIVGTPFASDFASITVEDQILNLDQMILRGASELRTQEGVQNEANLDIVFANATVDGDVTNAASGVVSVSGGSQLNHVGDLVNDGTFIVSTDSSYSLLGALQGNGIEGPGGPGTAGTVFVRDGVSGRSGGPGTIGFDGRLSLGSNATTTIRLGGTSAGIDYDQLIVAGTFNAAGTIRFESVGGFVPQPGDVFQVLGFDAIQGAFGAIEFDQTLAGVGIETSNLLIDGTIGVPADCPADVNGNGDLDPGDFTAWVAAYNAGNPTADQNGNGVLDPGDFTAWIANFNAGCP